MQRRHFLMGTAVAAGVANAHGLASPNDTIRIACVGVKGRGKDHLDAYLKMPNVEVAAVCDIDESVLAERVDMVGSKAAKKPAAYTDFRKLLEDRTIDAVSIATPNHHHTLQTIWALQAGKHVFVEKPCSHDMFEAKQIAAAAKKYSNLLVQHGTQSRSMPSVREAIQKLRDGVIGDIYMARGLCFKWRDTIGRAAEEAVPDGVHYDLWLGPAPVRAFTKNRFHYKWHWFWDYGNGDIGNQGPHQSDICRWGLDVKYPYKVSAMGGHFTFDDDQETPNVITAAYEFRDSAGVQKHMVFEVRHWMTNHEAGIDGGPNRDSNTMGAIFYGSKGCLAIEYDGRYQSWLGRDQQHGPANFAEANHWQNFIGALRSGKAADLSAPIEEGAISTTLVHLANISYRLGRTLNFDAGNYRCEGDAEATAMFRRSYRAPFVVPDQV
jgi:predicted dehydrogenase